MKQLGLGILQYTQDYDEQLPKGAGVVSTASAPSSERNKATLGAGWAGNIMPYVKSAQVYACPSDSTKIQKFHQRVSYGFNINLAGGYQYGKLASLGSPTLTVMLCEFQNSQTPLDRDNEGFDDATANSLPLSPSTSGYRNGSGCRNIVGSCAFTIGGGSTNMTSYQNYYLATSGGTPGNNVSPAFGLLGGSFPSTSSTTQYYYGAAAAAPYDGAVGVHLEGSNFLLADGHVKWFKPDQVSPGFTATAGQFQGQSNGGYSAASVTNMKLSNGATPCAVTFSPI